MKFFCAQVSPNSSLPFLAKYPNQLITLSKKEMEEFRDGESIVPFWFRTEFQGLPEKKRFIGEVWEENFEEEVRERDLETPTKVRKQSTRSPLSTSSNDSVFVSCLSEETIEYVPKQNLLTEESVERQNKQQDVEEKEFRDQFKEKNYEEIMVEYRKCVNFWKEKEEKREREDFIRKYKSKIWYGNLKVSNETNHE